MRARRGMFYNRYDQPATTSGELGTETDINLRQQLVYHVLGTPQARTPLPSAIQHEVKMSVQCSCCCHFWVSESQFTCGFIAQMLHV